MEFVCTFCRQPIRLKTGGSAFIYSQILMHLERCSSRPPKVTGAEVVLIANELMNKAIGW
jgi:hypothetical protein